MHDISAVYRIRRFTTAFATAHHGPYPSYCNKYLLCMRFYLPHIVYKLGPLLQYRTKSINCQWEAVLPSLSLCATGPGVTHHQYLFHEHHCFSVSQYVRLSLELTVRSVPCCRPSWAYSWFYSVFPSKFHFIMYATMAFLQSVPTQLSYMGRCPAVCIAYWTSQVSTAFRRFTLSLWPTSHTILS
jgi:hypothetical protein